MAGEGKFAVNVESIYVETPEGIMTLIDYLQHNSGSDVDWSSLTGKPSTFPPAEHEHAAGDVTSGTFDAARVPSLPQSKVSGLADALAGKADAAALDAKADVSALDAKADASALTALEQRVADLEAAAEPEA